MRIVEDDLDLDGEDDFTQGKVIGEDIDTFVGDDDNYAEVEMVAAEPTKVVDVDGSIVIVSPGDTVTIKSESIKRVSSLIKEEKESDEADEKSDENKKETDDEEK